MDKVVTTKSFTKALIRLPVNWQKRIVVKVKEIAADPYAKRDNVTKLQGRDGYRLRIGGWSDFTLSRGIRFSCRRDRETSTSSMSSQCALCFWRSMTAAVLRPFSSGMNCIPVIVGLVSSRRVEPVLTLISTTSAVNRIVGGC